MRPRSRDTHVSLFPLFFSKKPRWVSQPGAFSSFMCVESRKKKILDKTHRFCFIQSSMIPSTCSTGSLVLSPDPAGRSGSDASVRLRRFFFSMAFLRSTRSLYSSVLLSIATMTYLVPYREHCITYRTGSIASILIDWISLSFAVPAVF